MKRKYITPTIEVVKVAPVSMMAISSQGGSIDKGEGGVTDDNKDDFEILSRDDNNGASSNIWDSAW